MGAYAYGSDTNFRPKEIIVLLLLLFCARSRSVLQKFVQVFNFRVILKAFHRSKMEHLLRAQATKNQNVRIFNILDFYGTYFMRAQKEGNIYGISQQKSI